MKKPGWVDEKIWQVADKDLRNSLISAHKEMVQKLCEQRNRILSRAKIRGEDRIMKTFGLDEVPFYYKEEAQEVLDGCVAYAKSYYATHEMPGKWASVPEPTLEFIDSDRRFWADMNYGKNRIRLFPLGQTVNSLLHEYAHFLAGRMAKPHGKEFKLWHWRLVSWYITWKKEKEEKGNE